MIDREAGPSAWQVKLFEEVAPLDRVAVGFNDFHLLGGEIVWQDDDLVQTTETTRDDLK